MPFNGSGTFNPLSAPTFPAVTGAVIFAARFNSNLTDIHQGLSNCLTRDGQSVPTANLPMGGMKLTGLAAGTSPGDSLRYDEFALLEAVVTDEAMHMRGELATAQNLNDLTSAGTYSLTALSTSTNIPTSTYVENAPTTDSATLVVARGGVDSTVISQMLTVGGERTYTRQYLGSWTNWREIGRYGGEIAASTNFDTLTRAGTYNVTTANITSCTNRPTAYVSTTSTEVVNGGILRVWTFSGRIIQTYQVASGVEYTRFYVPGTGWGDWANKYPTGYQGTFTPALTATSGTTNISYSARAGYYWRNGPLVYFYAYMTFSHDQTWLQAQLNVPVEPMNFGGATLAGPIANVVVSDTIATVFGGFFAQFQSNDPATALRVRGYCGDSTVQGTISLSGNHLAATTTIHYSGWYIAAANS